eukprot:scaffold8693_cov119-Isochrysis_galbana.AAC.2
MSLLGESSFGCGLDGSVVETMSPLRVGCASPPETIESAGVDPSGLRAKGSLGAAVAGWLNRTLGCTFANGSATGCLVGPVPKSRSRSFRRPVVAGKPNTGLLSTAPPAAARRPIPNGLEPPPIAPPPLAISSRAAASAPLTDPPVTNPMGWSRWLPPAAISSRAAASAEAMVPPPKPSPAGRPSAGGGSRPDAAGAPNGWRRCAPSGGTTGASAVGAYAAPPESTGLSSSSSSIRRPRPTLGFCAVATGGAVANGVPSAAAAAVPVDSASIPREGLGANGKVSRDWFKEGRQEAGGSLSISGF